jgi:hypothetical protein
LRGIVLDQLLKKMPDKDCHLAVARRNQELIDRLLAAGNTHPEWIAVIAFYKALHIVDAVLFVNHPDKHGGSHENRNRISKTTIRYQNIYRHYRPIFSASLIGRYLEDNYQSHHCFAEYMSSEDVVNTILNHHLKQLEKSAEKIIGAISPISSQLPPDPDRPPASA